jgi:hypothetical protein
MTLLCSAIVIFRSIIVPALRSISSARHHTGAT